MGIIKDAVNGKNVFHTTTDAPEKTLLEGCVDDIVDDSESFVMNCSDLLK